MSKRMLEDTLPDVRSSKRAHRKTGSTAVTSGLHDLPNETIRVEIAQHLGMVSRVWLTWTCRSMLAAFNGRPYAGDSRYWARTLTAGAFPDTDRKTLYCTQAERVMALRAFDCLSCDARLAEWQVSGHNGLAVHVYWLSNIKQNASCSLELARMDDEDKRFSPWLRLSISLGKHSTVFHAPYPCIDTETGIGYLGTIARTCFYPEYVAVMRAIAEKRSRECLDDDVAADAGTSGHSRHVDM
jgi:hypothetical protein